VNINIVLARTIICVGALLGLSLCAFGAQPLATALPIAVDASNAKTGIVEGLQITATLDKRSYNAGSPIYLVVHLTNTTSQKITMLFPYVSAAAYLNVIVRASDGKQAQLTARSTYTKPDFDKPYVPDSMTSIQNSLAAGASYAFILLPNIVYDMTRTQDYYVSVKIMIPKLTGAGTAVLETKPMLLSVVDPDHMVVPIAPYPTNPSGAD